MPLIVWSYPRGAAIDAKGGKDSFYAVDMPPARPASWARTSSRLADQLVVGAARRRTG
jgi:hypothetical protein